MIHIDGASGAFIAPFQYPDLLWRAPCRTARTALHAGRLPECDARRVHAAASLL